MQKREHTPIPHTIATSHTVSHNATHSLSITMKLSLPVPEIPPVKPVQFLFP